MPLTNSWLRTYAIAQLGKPYIYGTWGQIEESRYTDYNGKPNPYFGQQVKMHDCSGLVCGALWSDSTTSPATYNKVGIEHSADSQYRRYCTNKGPLSAALVPSLPPGTLVFHDNGGEMSHVGIYVGPLEYKGVQHQYAVVEAMGKAYGVVVSDATQSKWTHWGQLDICEVNTSATDMQMLVISDSYGGAGATPTIGNQSGVTYSGVGETVSSVRYVQTGTDEWGNPIGYSYTTGYNFTPFIACVGPNARKVDYPALVSAKVSGMVFCAGWLYDDYRVGHVPRKEYVNPHLQDQIAACEAAGYPYGLYAIVRAKNRIEADQECKDLYYVISKYPPRLGLWLLLDMHNSPPPTMNETVLDCYYKYITEWGLSAKCGLYLDKSRILQIDWRKYQNKFYLWLVDHINNQHTLDTINDEVLKSSFFEVE